MFRRNPFSLVTTFALVLASAHSVNKAHAQQFVTLPAPRLLTLMPMGASVGSTVEIAVTGENIDEEQQLVFSSPKITAQPKTDATGLVVKNRFVATIAQDAQVGLVEARLMTRLGISSARCFSVGKLTETTRLKPNTSTETALALQSNSVCNAFTTARAVDYYSFTGKQGQRYTIDCAAAGIDSKLTPVVILADAQGRDLQAERRSGFLDVTVPADGKYLIKVQGLTYQGGPENFYRLALSELAPDQPAERQPSTQRVGAASVPSVSQSTPVVKELEPNDQPNQAQKLSLPCAIHGSFATAGDVDSYEFEAKKGDVWWMEVVSERLGLPTDPFVVVQKVTKTTTGEQLADAAEFNDIVSPVKLSTNGYAYDGPPYDAGSADSLGKFEAKEDGTYRIRIRDLFGGTRADQRNVYKLIIRRAEPAFSLVAWALHMELRNGDRAALSKPVSLRNGTTMGFDVIAIRKDGFDGDIQLAVENLPPGVSATGLRIPAGKSQGYVLLTAAENAERGVTNARLIGRAKIGADEVTRTGATASMVWPVKDANGEVPVPRLLADFPISVGGSESAPLRIAPANPQILEAKAGSKLSVPLALTWKGDFSGGSMKLKPLGSDFAAAPALDVALKAPTAELVLDLAQLKTSPGEYTLAMHGGVVAKYAYNPAAVKAAEALQKTAEAKVQEAADELQKLANVPKAGGQNPSPDTSAAIQSATERMKAAEAAKADASKRLKAASDAAAPKEIVDIVFSEPIRIRVTPAEVK